MTQTISWKTTGGAEVTITRTTEKTVTNYCDGHNVKTTETCEDCRVNIALVGKINETVFGINVVDRDGKNCLKVGNLVTVIPADKIEEIEKMQAARKIVFDAAWAIKMERMNDSIARDKMYNRYSD